MHAFELDLRQSIRDLAQKNLFRFVQLSTDIWSELGNLSKKEFGFQIRFRLRTENSVPLSAEVF